MRVLHRLARRLRERERTTRGDDDARREARGVRGRRVARRRVAAARMRARRRPSRVGYSTCPLWPHSMYCTYCGHGMAMCQGYVRCRFGVHIARGRDRTPTRARAVDSRVHRKSCVRRLAPRRRRSHARRRAAPRAQVCAKRI